MIENQKIRPASVIGPLGELLTIESLPAPGTDRWVARRKAQVVSAVNGGLLTIEEVCDRYSLTGEEFESWQRSLDRSGLSGLKVTKIQYYRDLWGDKPRKQSPAVVADSIHDRRANGRSRLVRALDRIPSRAVSRKIG